MNLSDEIQQRSHIVSPNETPEPRPRKWGEHDHDAHYVMVESVLRTVDGPEPEKPTHPAGHYRMIHGGAWIPTPIAQLFDENGRRRDNVRPLQLAKVGDELWLNERDATMMVNQDMVEHIDASPSRVGQVWDPPQPARIRNY